MFLTILCLAQEIVCGWKNVASESLNSLKFFQVTSDSLRSIATLPYLEDLALVGCPLVDDFG